MNTPLNTPNDTIVKIVSFFCPNEPWDAKKYANLILDIDASNKEALKYL